MQQQYKVIAPFSNDVFEDISPNWLFWNNEICTQCHMEDIYTVSFSSPLQSQIDKHKLLKNTVTKQCPQTTDAGCLLFSHKAFGILYSSCRFSNDSMTLSKPRLAYHKKREFFRLGEVEHILDDNIKILNISECGCLLNAESDIGKVRQFSLKLKQNIDVVAFCVHNEQGHSGWCFPLWKYEDERSYRNALGGTIPPLAQKIQQLSAQRSRIAIKH